MKNLSYRKVGDKLHITVNVHDPDALIEAWEMLRTCWHNPRDFFLCLANWFTPNDELEKASDGWNALVDDLVYSDLDANYPPATKWMLGLTDEDVSCSPQVCLNLLSLIGARKFDVDANGDQVATFAPPNVPAA